MADPMASEQENFLMIQQWLCPNSECMQTSVLSIDTQSLGMFLKEVLTQNIGSLKMATCWMIKVYDNSWTGMNFLLSHIYTF